MRQEKPSHVLFHTVFAQRVHHGWVHPGHKHRIIRRKLVFNLKKVRTVILYVLFNVEHTLNRLTADITEADQVVAVSINDHRVVALGDLIIHICCHLAPNHVPDRLQGEHRHKQERTAKAHPRNAYKEVDENQTEKVRQKLRKSERTRTEIAKCIAVEGFVEPHDQGAIPHGHKDIITQSPCNLPCPLWMVEP